MTSLPHPTSPPSAWVQRWAGLIRPHGRVLDVACGTGRHMQYLMQQGHTVTGVDRSEGALHSAKAFGSTVLADLENAPWPLMDTDQPRQFDAVIVTNYLWRPLFDAIRHSVAPGGVLIYETFAAGNETIGKPSRPDFLLQPGELLARCQGLRVVAYEDGFLAEPDRFVQRIAAVHTPASLPESATWARYTL